MQNQNPNQDAKEKNLQEAKGGKVVAVMKGDDLTQSRNWEKSGDKVETSGSSDILVKMDEDYAHVSGNLSGGMNLN
ncbi:hypothetical protein GUJ93_ZPchr0012g22206 [Zizania palustris]|uniref:Uncharacterized protein n=1 Tax=Zizania palustris TaxID=103762 RepID=A0A8J5WKT3_ZIZPA|nr:hypothetical protein GUJ93_ZPchr0012g22206 [Zizania palustris]